MQMPHYASSSIRKPAPTSPPGRRAWIASLTRGQLLWRFGRVELRRMAGLALLAVMGLLVWTIFNRARRALAEAAQRASS